jgi:hypothetical protein
MSYILANGAVQCLEYVNNKIDIKVKEIIKHVNSKLGIEDNYVDTFKYLVYLGIITEEYFSKFKVKAFTNLNSLFYYFAQDKDKIIKQAKDFAYCYHIYKLLKENI